MQCMYTAMTSTAAATGIRGWLNTRRWNWLTPQRLHRVTMGLIVAALVASAFLVPGSAGASH
jgi:hypothetical protein